MPIPLKHKPRSVAACKSENQHIKYTDTSVSSNHRVPFGELERNSTNYQQCNRNTYADMPLKFMRTNNHEMVPNISATSQKENVRYFGWF